MTVAVKGLGPGVLVIGGGIIGASIAFHLAEAGARVTLADPGTGMPQATPGSIAWINASSDHDPDYFAFRMQSIHLWRDLLAVYPDLPVRFDGGIFWGESREETEGRAAEDERRGYPSRLLSRSELSAMAPQLTGLPPVALYSKLEGMADPEQIAGVFTKLAMAHGATVLRERVREILCADGRVIGARLDGDGSVVLADMVVLAAGVSSGSLLDGLGIALPLLRSPGVLVRSEPVPRVLDPFLCSPGLHGWQMADGRLIAGTSFEGAPPGACADDLADEVISRLEERFPALYLLKKSGVTMAERPIPADGLPIIGPAPALDSLWLAACHSGVTLAPVIGRLSAARLIGGKAVPELDPYRLSRFDLTAVSKVSERS